MQLNSATFRGEKGTAVPELRVFAALREVQPRARRVRRPAAAGAATKIDIRESVAVSDSPGIGGDSPRASRAEPTRAGAKDDDLAGIAKASAPPPATTTSARSPCTSSPSPQRFASSPPAGCLSRPPRSRSSSSSPRRSPRLGGAGGPRAALGGGSRAHQPPATVARASEVTLQNGVGSVDFGAGVMGLAAVPRRRLPPAPRFGKDKYAADQLLGTATVSLAPLLQEPVLDGYAPVMAAVDPDNAMNPRSATAAEHGRLVEGALRMVLARGEGPVAGVGEQMGGYDPFPLAASVAGPTQPVPVTPAAQQQGPDGVASIERAAAD